MIASEALLRLMPVDICYMRYLRTCTFTFIGPTWKKETWAKETVYDTIFAHFTADLPYSAIKKNMNYNKYEFIN